MKKGSRYYYLRYDEKLFRLTRRRQQETTEAFKERYRWRAGIEATMSQYDRLTGVKHLRVRGFKAVRFAAVMKAAAVNIARAAAAMKTRLRALDPDSAQYRANWRLLQLFKEHLNRFFRLLVESIKTISDNWVISHKSI